jgi:polyisoprenoid-binding protein YceI
MKLTLTAVILASSVAFAQSPAAPLAADTARITIAGTSNVHDYTASTTQARVTRAQFSCDAAGATFWDDVAKPGGLEAFDIAIAAGTLKSEKDGLDKNMHKALKVREHADITFSLKRMEGAPGSLKAVGTLRIAGVEREVVLPLVTARKGNALAVTGAIEVLMTDFGIAPPKALMGMVKADPKVTVSFEVLLAVKATT